MLAVGEEIQGRDRLLVTFEHSHLEPLLEIEDTNRPILPSTRDQIPVRRNAKTADSGFVSAKCRRQSPGNGILYSQEPVGMPGDDDRTLPRIGQGTDRSGLTV